MIVPFEMNKQFDGRTLAFDLVILKNSGMLLQLDGFEQHQQQI